MDGDLIMCEKEFSGYKVRFRANQKPIFVDKLTGLERLPLGYISGSGLYDDVLEDGKQC